MIEGKGPGGGMTAGQRRLFNRYAELPTHTGLILWGDAGEYNDCCLLCGAPTPFAIKTPPNPKFMQIWPNEPIACNRALVKQFAREWWQQANQAAVPLISSYECRSTSETLRKYVANQKLLERLLKDFKKLA